MGIKIMLNVTGESKIITAFSVTDASVHDSLEFVGLIDEKDCDVKVDSGYVGEYKDEILRLFPGISVHVCARAFRNKPLSEVEKVGNRVIACVRCRVEHVFGYMSCFMGVLFVGFMDLVVWVGRLLVRI